MAVHLRHVPIEDLEGRPPRVWADAVQAQTDLALRRLPGETLVQVLVDGTEVGAAPGRSVLQVITDDRPFLVDSVQMEVARQGRGTDLVLHPRFWAERDPGGKLLRAQAREERDSAGPGWFAESWIRVETERVGDESDVAHLVQGVQRVLDDVRGAVEDYPAMLARLQECAARLPADDPSGALLTWITEDHFTFLGAADLSVALDGSADPIVGTGLGIFAEGPGKRLPEAESVSGSVGQVLVVDKALDRSTVHRPGNLDRLTVRTFDASGRVVAERRFLGLWSSRARTESVLRVPVLRENVAEVLRRVGVQPDEHAGKAVVDALESYPRDQLFAAEVEALVPVARSAAVGGESKRLRAFVRHDPRGRYVSVLVQLPRERYSTAVRERLSAELKDLFVGDQVEFAARMDEARTARVHFVVQPEPGQVTARPDDAEVESRLAEVSRSWRDDLTAHAVEVLGAERGSELAKRWGDGLPEGYKATTGVDEAVEDLQVLDALPEGEVAFRMVTTHEASEHLDVGRLVARLKVVRAGQPVHLARVLPLLHSAGVEVVDERPHEVTGPHGPAWVYDFLMSHPSDVPYATPEVFVDAVRAMWEGRCEVDGFNTLVLEAGLTWRQVAVLRAQAAYLRQGRFPFTRASTVAAMRANVEVTRALVQLFDVRFDPDRYPMHEVREQAAAAVKEQLESLLADVERRDHDRILRAHLAVLEATQRTNHFRTDAVGEGPSGTPAGLRAHLAFKLLPREVPGLPEPRPQYEIYVHSPLVEGVHLRFGAVARGGLRWSDRFDDFRTEVLGLVKAQMVKNTVIVPVGAKGGFVARQLPDPKNRQAWLEAGVTAYRAFISCLLDVTDNLVDGVVVPPPRVLRRDGDDHYLVVAADKGTASFSDHANGVAAAHGFWLGDAFASGGSVGYDHKAMGITARGAWVSVQRHFRELGIDVQSEEFTCVGIGDMSGDVFGNGLLRSDRARLVAAFDHRDIFIDPTPDAETSFAERLRLFETPRSSWQDYERALISEGGGVFSRGAKTVPVSRKAAIALGIGTEAVSMAPEDLIRAVLTAPVDLLWNGGIGTYVKASGETHDDVGDHANDTIRVDGRDLRVKVVGEGGNLGLTQAGRVEFARTARNRGGDDHPTPGAVNTDFIDNSAGVDTSDHEVNIKILLDAVVASGELPAEERTPVLASMTDEVAELVLADNYRQNLALADEAVTAADALHVHEQWMRTLEERGVLDRALESLPSRTEVRRRREAAEGLTLPELSVLLSWTKIVMADELIASDLPDHPYLRGDLIGYFPHALRQDHRAAMAAHPLHREIVVTQVVNTVVDEAGITAWTQTAEETGASAAQFAMAHLVAGELFGCSGARGRIADLDHAVAADVQASMRAKVRALQSRTTRWLLARAGGAVLDVDVLVDAYSVPVQRLLARLPSLLEGEAQERFEARRLELVEAGVPLDLAATVAVMPESSALLDVVATARKADADPDDVVRVHLALGERCGLRRLSDAVTQLPRTSRWAAAAASALDDDLGRVRATLTAAVVAEGSDLAAGDPAAQAESRVEHWTQARAPQMESVGALVTEILDEGPLDLARASVAVRAVRGLLAE